MAATENSLKEYLKKYKSESNDQSKKKRKKSKIEPRANPIGAGVLVVDEDPIWQKPIVEEEEESADDEMPQIHEDIEVTRTRRLEAVRDRNRGIAEDGSGWVSISDQPNASNDADRDSDLSQPRQRRPRFDTPSPRIEQDAGDSEEVDRRLGTPLPESNPRVSDSGDVADDDMSPSRKKITGDLSPPRRNRNRLPEFDGDHSPHSAWHELPVDSRRRGSLHVDLSPPRRRKEPSLAKDEDLSPPRRKTGLLSAEEIRKEIERKKKEETSRFASMDPSMTGQGAEVVFRDKEGRRINKEELLKAQQEAQQEEKPKGKKLEWGKGLAQKRDSEARMKELELEKHKPFSRTRDDPDLDKMLKGKIRWGDPMAYLVKQKNSEPFLEDLGTDEKMKESGFIIPQSIPSHSWMKRGIDCPPNRYGIQPGRHWDGVDRSNGYEKDSFNRQNDKRATETEAYLWSVADM